LINGNGSESDGSDNKLLLSDDEPLPAIITICDDEDRARREAEEQARRAEDAEEARREEGEKQARRADDAEQARREAEEELRHNTQWVGYKRDARGLWKFRTMENSLLRLFYVPKGHPETMRMRWASLFLHTVLNTGVGLYFLVALTFPSALFIRFLSVIYWLYQGMLDIGNHHNFTCAFQPDPCPVYDDDWAYPVPKPNPFSHPRIDDDRFDDDYGNLSKVYDGTDWKRYMTIIPIVVFVMMFLMSDYMAFYVQHTINKWAAAEEAYAQASKGLVLPEYQLIQELGWCMTAFRIKIGIYVVLGPLFFLASWFFIGTCNHFLGSVILDPAYVTHTLLNALGSILANALKSYVAAPYLFYNTTRRSGLLGIGPIRLAKLDNDDRGDFKEWSFKKVLPPEKGPPSPPAEGSLDFGTILYRILFDGHKLMVIIAEMYDKPTWSSAENCCMRKIRIFKDSRASNRECFSGNFSRAWEMKRTAAGLKREQIAQRATDRNSKKNLKEFVDYETGFLLFPFYGLDEEDGSYKPHLALPCFIAAQAPDKEFTAEYLEELFTKDDDTKDLREGLEKPPEMCGMIGPFKIICCDKEGNHRACMGIWSCPFM
jgi:hypothetical protein